MRIVTMFIMTVLLFVTNLLNAQNSMTSLKVIEINELDDKVFEIRALKKSGDTIRLLSIKERINDSCLYERIRKGAEYQFELESRPAYIDNFIIRVGESVYWKTGDDPKEMPYFANNLKSDFIKKNLRKYL